MKQRTPLCPNCRIGRVSVTATKRVPGKHYHCDRCGHEWQDRVVRRYRQRQTLTTTLLQRILDRKNLLSPGDRFFVEKMHERGKSSLKFHTRLLRIAQKIEIDLRDED